ncbi:MAG: DUF4407 domain-containing protein, partial [Nostoc sp. DedSLP03]|uniref:DUF4407 domain-containing protein n=1 Tax=Nostoc sp. DedSLP03 TaxID=3075400 RepID=UPI002AD28ED2
MKKIKNFLLFCSGVTIPIILRNACITEHDKYASIGAIILLTAILAVLSGGYALYSIFQSKILSGIFGLFWGAFIFTLDRLFVSSIKKGNNEKWFSPLLMAAPRILLAVIISIVIARPLELKIFEKEIDGQRLQDIDKSYRQFLKDSGEQNLIDNINKIKNKLNEAQTRTRNFRLFGRTTVSNISESDFQKQLAKDIEEEKKIQSQIDNTENSLTILRKNSQNNAEKTHPKTLLIQLTTLRQLEKNNEEIFWISVFITSLFIVIETSPIIVKLLSDTGPYEQFLKAHEETVPSVKDDYKNQKIIDEKSEIEEEAKINKAIRDNFYYLLNDVIEKLKDSPEKSEQMNNVVDIIFADLLMQIKKKFIKKKFSDSYRSIDFTGFKQQSMETPTRSRYGSDGSSRNPQQPHSYDGSSRNPQQPHSYDGSSR